MRLRVLFTLLLGVFLMSGAAWADGDFYVISGGGGVGTPITNLPYTITQAGFYYLKGNLHAPKNGITIEASDVTLDLMGFRITGNGSTTWYGIEIPNSDTINVEVRNGTVRGFYMGIRSYGGSCRIINIRAYYCSTGILVASGYTFISGCTAAYNTINGFNIGGSASLIGNGAFNNTTRGFWLNNYNHQLVDRNVASLNGINWVNLTGCTIGINTP
jgi:hypothetical protein